MDQLCLEVLEDQLCLGVLVDQLYLEGLVDQLCLGVLVDLVDQKRLRLLLLDLVDLELQ